MGAPGQIYISCAKDDAEQWLKPVAIALDPLIEKLQVSFWDQETAKTVGPSMEYHAAILLVTQKYLASESTKNELSRFSNFTSKGRGFFWILIEDVADLSKFENFNPAWGGEKIGEPVQTVVSLNEKQYSGVWAALGRKLESWWREIGSKLPEKLEDTRIANQVVVEPKPTPSGNLNKLKDPGLLRLLPCLIDRVPQETPVKRRLGSREGKIVFIIPGQREERPDRFADRLDSYTIAEVRAKNEPRSNLEFCRVGWPSYLEGDSASDRFEEYLDGVFKTVRLDFTVKNDPVSMTAAAAALRQRMKETRYLFWTEVTAGTPGKTSKDLFSAVFEWWKNFLPGPGADFFPPVVVLAITATKNTLTGLLPDTPPGEHVEQVNELSPIGYQDMVNWVGLAEIRGFDSGGGLRSKIDELYPKSDERISFATIDENVKQWLAAST